jgi:hypothetical protein
MKPTNLCQHLRTKKMYIPAQAHEAFSGEAGEDGQANGHCWCNCTLTETGPDDGPVGPERCRFGRFCFEE